jgi:hypothetical protein
MASCSVGDQDMVSGATDRVNSWCRLEPWEAMRRDQGLSVRKQYLMGENQRALGDSCDRAGTTGLWSG